MERKEKTLQDFFQDYKLRFSKMTIDELIEVFNREVGNMGWVGIRGAYLAALHQEFLSREFDCSQFIFEDSTSLQYKIRLEGKKLVQIID
ncbi:hypothetical protein [Capnocytophaga stomatis]|uniref:Uncharacterized protein n=1 Tax=Capnocytophaga stomatis TaxID=1848904 RepID=A0A250FVW9_9FLAO|nr:hypothetical protein [Capnocytophaga stomatis]ATA89233.1 hypothetical protein CGC58_05545 [Capnocytophaga stomatis]GIJ93710.1 hypothetical protein CAPN002_09280 [Capnocytophaga stomatis]GIJ96826.1 hypothetical protein CAPN001_13950 [Capnocytophaga stomatis]